MQRLTDLDSASAILEVAEGEAVEGTDVRRVNVRRASEALASAARTGVSDRAPNVRHSGSSRRAASRLVRPPLKPGNLRPASIAPQRCNHHRHTLQPPPSYLRNSESGELLRERRVDARHGPRSQLPQAGIGAVLFHRSVGLVAPALPIELLLSQVARGRSLSRGGWQGGSCGGCGGGNLRRAHIRAAALDWHAGRHARTHQGPLRLALVTTPETRRAI